MVNGPRGTADQQDYRRVGTRNWRVAVNSDEHYTLAESRNVSATFRRLSEKASREGRFVSFVKSAKWIQEELTRTPLEFGEARYAVPTGRFLYRVGYAGPITVDFAVDPSIECLLQTIQTPRLIRYVTAGS